MNNKEFDFQKMIKSDIQLNRSAKVAVRDVLKIKEGEKVLIITNPNNESLPVSQHSLMRQMRQELLPLLLFRTKRHSLILQKKG